MRAKRKGRGEDEERFWMEKKGTAAERTGAFTKARVGRALRRVVEFVAEIKRKEWMREGSDEVKK